METAEVGVASTDEHAAGQSFYEARAYGGAPIAPSDYVVVAKHLCKIVGVGRLCQEKDLLWLRGMQVQPEFQRLGVGTRILTLLSQEIGSRWCCCLPYEHLLGFYHQAGFEAVIDDLPPALSDRLADYAAKGLRVIAMVRSGSRPDNSVKPEAA